MPTNNPVVGEVWSHNGDGSTVAAVASELGAGHGYQLIGRTGRLINVPRSSMRLMWTFTGNSHTGQCSIEGCLFDACARVQTNWYCGSHVPRNQAVRLPGDQDVATPTVAGGGLTHCPLCNAPRDSSSPTEMIEEVIVNRCTCRARWVTLVARGMADDGFNLGEDIQTAHAVLESEFCSPIRAVTGTGAFGALRRSFREMTEDRPRFAGIELEIDDSMGTTNIIVLGAPSEANDEQTNHLVGLLHTYWGSDEGVVFHLIALHEELHAGRVVVLSNVVLPDELRKMSEEWLKSHYKMMSGPPVVVEEDGVRHVTLPGEFIGSLVPRGQIPIIPENFQEEIHVTITAEPSEKRPVTGETWWHVDTGKQVEVFGVGKTRDGLEYVRFEPENDCPTRMVLEAFLRYHTYENGDEAPLVADSEHVQLDGTGAVLIKAVHGHTVTLVPTSAANDRSAQYAIRTTQFRRLYKPLIRRSATDRLMDEEDLV